MAVDAELLQRVKRSLAGEAGVGERRMFGGVCFTIGGHMACGVQGRELVVRVGPERHVAALAERHVRPMDFTGKPMKGFVYVAPDGLADARQLRKWLRRGIGFARSLPPKTTPPRQST
jgi:TfoX/Sxy family transcriptional regulator of competence genes